MSKKERAFVGFVGSSFGSRKSRAPRQYVRKRHTEMQNKNKAKRDPNDETRLSLWNVTTKKHMIASTMEKTKKQAPTI